MGFYSVHHYRYFNSICKYSLGALAHHVASDPVLSFNILLYSVGSVHQQEDVFSP